MTGKGGALAASVRATAAYLPRPGLAATVLAPPYDDPAAPSAGGDDAGNPLGFLNELRSEIDAPQHTDARRQEMLAETVTQLHALLDSEVFDLYGPPAFFVCRLALDGHVQTGIVADVALDAYDRGLVKVHELTRRGQEDRLMEYMSAVRASFLPVFLIHRPAVSVDAVIADIVDRSPTIDVETEDGLLLTVWAVSDPAEVAVVQAALGELDALYVADGHHRTAAASRFAAACVDANPDHRGDEPYSHMLAVLFSSDQLVIQPYDRCVTSIGERSPEELLHQLRMTFAVEELQVVPRAPEAGEYLMRLANHWYRVTAPHDLRDQPGVAGLDVSILHDQVIGPVLGIEDLRTDPRIEFVPGTRGADELARLCRGPLAVSFALHPMSLPELMEVADRGELLPPKSTYFVPKLRSGLIVRLL